MLASILAAMNIKDTLELIAYAPMAIVDLNLRSHGAKPIGSSASSTVTRELPTLCSRP